MWSHPSLTTLTSFMLGQKTVWVGRGLQTSYWKLCKLLLLVKSLAVAERNRNDHAIPDGKKQKEILLMQNIKCA